MVAIQDDWQHVWSKLSGIHFSLQVSIMDGRAMVIIFVILVMANIQNGQQHDNWSKMTTKGPLHPNWKFDFFIVLFNVTLCG